MNKFLIISAIAGVLASTSFAHAQKDVQPNVVKSASQHDNSFGEAGSIRIFDKSKKIIASVKVKSGMKTIFINEELLRKGTPQAIKTLQAKDYLDFKNLLTKRLTDLSNGDNSDRVTWGFNCTFWCRQHEICENYEWTWPSFQ